MHDLYICFTDPNGENVQDSDKGSFVANGKQIPYTYKTSIEFNNEDKSYSIDWVNPVPFQKGTYNLVLYADGNLMGKSSVTLR